MAKGGKKFTQSVWQAKRGAANGTQKPIALVVDDMPEARRDVIPVLEKLGYATEEYGTGESAINRFIDPGKPPVSLVVTDCDMEKDDAGIRLMDNIRSDETRTGANATPIVFMSKRNQKDGTPFTAYAKVRGASFWQKKPGAEGFETQVKNAAALAHSRNNGRTL